MDDDDSVSWNIPIFRLLSD